MAPILQTLGGRQLNDHKMGRRRLCGHQNLKGGANGPCYRDGAGFFEGYIAAPTTHLAALNYSRTRGNLLRALHFQCQHPVLIQILA